MPAWQACPLWVGFWDVFEYLFTGYTKEGGIRRPSKKCQEKLRRNRYTFRKKCAKIAAKLISSIFSKKAGGIVGKSLKIAGNRGNLQTLGENADINPPPKVHTPAGGVRHALIHSLVDRQRKLGRKGLLGGFHRAPIRIETPVGPVAGRPAARCRSPRHGGQALCSTDH